MLNKKIKAKLSFEQGKPVAQALGDHDKTIACIHRQAQGADPRVRGRAMFPLSDIPTETQPLHHGLTEPLSWGQ